MDNAVKQHTFFLWSNKWEAYKPDGILQRIRQRYGAMRAGRGWTEDYILPTSVECRPVTETKERFFSKKKVEVTIGYNYILHFPRELTDAELAFWRGFVTGLTYRQNG